MKEELHKNQVAFQCRQALLARWVVPSVLSSSQEESHIALAAISTWKSQYIHLLKRPSNQSWATTEKKAGGVPLLHTLHFPFPRTTPTNQLGIRKQLRSRLAFDSNFDYFLIFHGLISNLHRGSTGRSQLLLSYCYLPFLNILGSLESLLASLLIPLNE